MKKLKEIVLIDMPEAEIRHLKENLKESAGLRMIAVDDPEEVLSGTLAESLQKLSDAGLVISGSRSVLEEAARRDIAAIGYQKPQSPFLQADMIVEGFEEVGERFLQRVFERHHHIPWTILETRRCILRELKPEDMEALVALYSYPGMTDYMEGLYPYEEELEYQKAYIENMYGFYGYGMWLVFEKESGKLIGRAGVEHCEELGGVPELGYAIGTPFQRQGYATEVCRAILAYVRRELDFKELVCLIEEGNEVSVHLAEKLGFQYGERLTIDGIRMLKYVLKL